MAVKAWKIGAAGSPSYPTEFEIVQKAVLQVTDIKTNRNKYYAIELHKAATTGFPYRVFTHYGRTDDLEKNPDAGVREGRYFRSEGEALGNYRKIYNQKTSPRKGYKEINLASSRIGSQKARGTSSGHVDAQTLSRLAQANKGAGRVKVRPKPSTLSAPLGALVKTLYAEATHKLTTTLQAQITANGIETPLGVLTLGQIERGEEILEEAYATFQKVQSSRRRRIGLEDKLVDLSGQFYTVVPHRLGRSREAVKAAVINTLPAFEQKQETLQLMRDMLKVSGESPSVLFNSELDQKYEALGCDMVALTPGSQASRDIRRLVEGSQLKSKRIKVKRVFSLRRENERARFDHSVGNERLLMHGSRAPNWVGILSRGLLMPKIVVSMGVNRTDAGWLGHGLYFGDAACTSLNYTSPARGGSRFMAITRVALGRARKYHKITYGLTEPPRGYDSTHGVRNERGTSSQFSDDEFVVYRDAQQQLEYLVEFTA